MSDARYIACCRNHLLNLYSVTFVVQVQIHQQARALQYHGSKVAQRLECGVQAQLFALHVIAEGLHQVFECGQGLQQRGWQGSFDLCKALVWPWWLRCARLGLIAAVVRGAASGQRHSFCGFGCASRCWRRPALAAANHRQSAGSAAAQCGAEFAALRGGQTW